LAQIGLESIAFLEARSAVSAGWKDSQLAVIADAEKPSALVRFVFLPDLRRLVEAVAAGPETAASYVLQPRSAMEAAHEPLEPANLQSANATEHGGPAEHPQPPKADSTSQ
jgi:hypothetical protein